METRLSGTTENGEELAFSQISPWNRELGTAASFHTLTTPMIAHRHDFLEIAFAVKGWGVHEDQFGRLPLLSGDVWIIQPGQWHAYPLITGSVSLFNLLLSREFLLAYRKLLIGTQFLDARVVSEVSETTPLSSVHLSPQGLERVLEILGELTRETRPSQQRGRTSICAGLVFQLLGLLERYGQAGSAKSDLVAVCAEPGLLAAIQHLEEHFAEPLTLDMLARQSGYASTYLIRKFRQYLGVSPMDYLLRVRLQHACSLLQTTRHSITTIAYEAGFSDSRYFATRFRHAFGMTPSEFRQQHLLDKISNIEDKILEASGVNSNVYS